MYQGSRFGLPGAEACEIVLRVHRRYLGSLFLALAIELAIEWLFALCPFYSLSPIPRFPFLPCSFPPCLPFLPFKISTALLRRASDQRQSHSLSLSFKNKQGQWYLSPKGPQGHSYPPPPIGPAIPREELLWSREIPTGFEALIGFRIRAFECPQCSVH